MKWLTVLLIFAVILAFGINVYVELTGETITGKPLQYVGLNITIIAPPVISLISPKNETYFVNTSIPLNFSIIGSTEKIWYSLDSGNNITVTSPLFFNVSEGGHSLFLYANNSVSTSSYKNVSFSVNSTIFQIIDEEWKGAKKGSSTNFTILSYEEVQNLSGIILENTDSGKILFNENINMTADKNFSDNQVDLDANVEISSNRIELKSIELPNFNKKATLWLYGLSFSDPRILKDGIVCPDAICTKESYSGVILKFNVTQFGIYSAEETPTTEVAIIPSGGGGGGIIGFLFPKHKIFSIDESEIKLSLTPGKVATKKVVLTNKLNKDIVINLEAQDIQDFVLIKEKRFTIPANDSKEISLDFIVREDTLPNMYLGKLIFKDNENKGEEEIFVVIEVESENVSLNVNAKIPAEYLKVPPNTKILVDVNLVNLNPEKKMNDIIISYIIKNEKGVKILEVKEIVSMKNETAEWVKMLTIPRRVQYSRYVLYISATTSDGKIASASENFEIVEPQVEKVYILIITLVLIVGIIILYFSILRKEKHEEIIKQLDIMDITGEE